MEKSGLPQKSDFFFYFLLNRNFAVCKIWALDPSVRAECFPHLCHQFKSIEKSCKRHTGVTKKRQQKIDFNKKVKNKTTLK